MQIASNRNIGIGTSTPIHKLHVSGNSAFIGQLTVFESVMINKTLSVRNGRIYFNVGGWGMYDETTTKRLYFSYDSANHGWMSEGGWDQQIIFTGQHRITSKNKDLHNTQNIGYIVSTTSKYKNINSKHQNNKTNITISDSLPPLLRYRIVHMIKNVLV